MVKHFYGRAEELKKAIGYVWMKGRKFVSEKETRMLSKHFLTELLMPMFVATDIQIKRPSGIDTYLE